MKKTLVALAVTAFAASATATTIYDSEGSKVDFDGSVRVSIEKSRSKVSGAKATTGHSYLKDAGSRFAVRSNHNIGENGLFALSRLEFRFNGSNDSAEADGFGDLYVKRAYVGLGHKAYGELTFGRQVTIADDIGETGYDYLYGVAPGLTTAEGNSVVRYDYKGIEGLQVGVNYNFGTARFTKNDAKLNPAHVEGELKQDAAKNGYGVGATYTFGVGEGQSVTLEAGYTRDNFVTGTNKRHYKDAWEVGTAYQINDLSLALDGSQAYDKNQGKETRTSIVAVAAKYALSPVNNVYGGYGFKHVKEKGANDALETHKYFVGTDYKLHKHVVTFVELGVARTPDTKKTESSVGAGLRVFW